MRMIGDRCYVIAVQEGSDAEAKGLKRGDAVLSLDGHIPSRDNLWGLRYVYRVLAPRGTTNLGVQGPGEQARQVEVKSLVEQKKKVLRLASGSDLGDYIRELEDRAWLGRHRFVEVGKKLLIWKMPEFDLAPGEVKSNMRKIRKHDALILDLRGNGGGSVEMLEHLVGSFLEGGVKIGDVKSRKRLKPITAKKLGDAYQGKLVVLVDSGSASASELFARVMQLEKRATVLGDRTSGSVMMSRFYSRTIGTGVQIFFGTSITVADIIMKDGHSLEHVGVVPDEVILPTAEDLVSGRDPLLSYAASLCGVTIDPEKAGSFFPVEWKR
jgi:C-terminal processing protease CtpA/Prc